MDSGTSQRLHKLSKKFNVGIYTIVDFLHQNGFLVDANPNSKIPFEACTLLGKEYKNYINLKQKIEIARQVRLQKLNDVAKEENIDHSLDEIIEDMEEVKRTEKKRILEDIFPEIEPPKKIKNDIDLSDDPDSEENIMRALENGYGDIYGFD